MNAEEFKNHLRDLGYKIDGQFIEDRSRRYVGFLYTSRRAVELAGGEVAYSYEDAFGRILAAEVME